MGSPLDEPEGNWWNETVNRRETLWMGLSTVWAAVLFGWMAGWARLGGQNQTGQTYRVRSEDYADKVGAFKEAAEQTDDGYLPPGTDVYVGAFRYGWDGLPVVLEAGTDYQFHLGSYDVQHGFSVRKEDTLSKQLTLQVLPGYEWVLEMSFGEPGTYHVVCNEFCGEGHRTMHGSFEVVAP